MFMCTLNNELIQPAIINQPNEIESNEIAYITCSSIAMGMEEFRATRKLAQWQGGNETLFFRSYTLVPCSFYQSHLSSPLPVSFADVLPFVFHD